MRSVTRQLPGCGGTSKAPVAFPRAGAPSSVSTQSAWSPWQPSAPEGIRTPNLLIRSQMLYPLSYGRECRPEIPCGIAQSNDGKDYRLDPAPTKSVCRRAQRAARHTSRRGGLSTAAGRPGPGLVGPGRRSRKARNATESAVFLQPLQEGCKGSIPTARL